MSQADLAKLLGISRSAIAQWESDTTSPSLQTTSEVARLLNTTPAYLAYGIDGQPKIVYRSPEEEGYASIREIVFGEKPEDLKEIAKWGAPTEWLRQELHCIDTSGLIVYQLEAANMEPQYEYGDKVLVDTKAQRVSPPGIFLHWDGVGPAINHITVVPGGDKKPTARISSTDGRTDPYEMPADRLKIIGRVRGHWRKA